MSTNLALLLFFFCNTLVLWIHGTLLTISSYFFDLFRGRKRLRLAFFVFLLSFFKIEGGISANKINIRKPEAGRGRQHPDARQNRYAPLAETGCGLADHALVLPAPVLRPAG